MRARMSSIESKTRAGPTCCSSAGVAAAGLMIAPRGARLPRSTAMPASAINGVSRGKITVSSYTGRSTR